MRHPFIPRAEWLAAAAVSVVAAAGYCRALATHPENWGIVDWDQHLFLLEAPRRIVLESHELPSWSPHYCGGSPLLANPQSRIIYPSFALILALGAPAGVKVDIVLHLALGLLGAYVLGRWLIGRRTAAIVAAATYLLSGMYAHVVAWGMSWILTESVVPWALAGLVAAQRGSRGGRWCTAIAIAGMVLGGGPYVAAISIVLLGLWAAITAAERASPRPVLDLGFALAIGAGLCAVKLLPTLWVLINYPRATWGEVSGLGIGSMVAALVHPEGLAGPKHDNGLMFGWTYGPDENLMYVGAVPFVLAAIGWLTEARRRLALAGCFVVLGWLCLGRNAAPLDLWEALHALPGFWQMRVAQRFRLGWLLTFGLFAGLGLDTIVRYGLRHGRCRRWVEPASAVVAVLVAGHLILVNGRPFAEAFVIPPQAPSPEPLFSQVRTWPVYGAPATTGAAPPLRTASAHLPALFANVGVIDCYETSSVPRNAIARNSPSYRGEVFFPDGEGTATLQRVSGGRFTIRTQTAANSKLVLNQNHMDGWSASDEHGRVLAVSATGRIDSRAGALVQIDVPAGEHQIELRYRPPWFRTGATVTAITVVAGSFAGWRRRTRRRSLV